MFENYLKASYRHLLKSKINFTFKLGGLTLGLSSFLVITLFVSHQLSFDRYHEDFENIYRVNSNRNTDGKTEQYAMVPSAIGPALKAEFPEVKSFTRISEPTRWVIRYDDKLIRSHGFVEADGTIFSVLAFEFIEGNQAALNRPGTIVLTKSLAEQIFGDESPIGKVLSVADKNNKTYEVTAVIKDLPRNTHFIINAITPIETLPFDSWEISWDGSVYLFVRLDNVNHDHFSEKINHMIERNISRNDNGPEKRFNVFLQPIAAIYLGANMEMEFFKKGNSLYVYIFSFLGLFLLVIVAINYINLSIADFLNRKKEIGVRKILGEKRRQIAHYIILEAVFLNFAALFISLVILYLLSPKVFPLLDPDLQFAMLFDPKILALVGLTVFLLAVCPTLYPALLLSRNSPVSDLSKGVDFSKNMSMGKSLLVMQCIVSVICISATLIVGNQIRYIQTKDLGYNRHNVISLIMPEEYPLEKALVLKNEMNKLASVTSASYAYYHITGVPYFKSEYEVEVNNKMETVSLAEVFVDHDYLNTMEIKLLTGRNFDISNAADSSKAFIINKTAAKEFGWSDPIGKRIRLKQDQSDNKKWDGTVIGVIEDVNTRSLHEKVEPVVMRLPFNAWPGYCLNIKIAGPVSENVSAVKSTFENVMPGFLADVRIVEDMFDNQYQHEDRAFKALQTGTWIIIFISCLGILSLSIYISVKRMKEFGIRKVMGATSTQITILHVGSFMKVALVANIIALPAAYWLMKEWLNGFEYHADPSVMIFLATAAILFLLVAIAAGYSSLRAGIMNPADVIKIE
jgi:putative ABC transport system permease protein